MRNYLVDKIEILTRVLQNHHLVKVYVRCFTVKITKIGIERMRSKSLIDNCLTTCFLISMEYMLARCFELEIGNIFRYEYL